MDSKEASALDDGEKKQDSNDPGGSRSPDAFSDEDVLSSPTDGGGEIPLSSQSELPEQEPKPAFKIVTIEAGSEAASDDSTPKKKPKPAGKLVTIEAGPEGATDDSAPKKILKRQDSIAVPWGAMHKAWSPVPGQGDMPSGHVGGPFGRRLVIDEEEARRHPKRRGLRALAHAREISALWQRKGRSGSQQRGSTSSLPQAPLILDGEADGSSEPDLATELIVSQQRKEFLCCFFLFCCGVAACKFLIIDQYKDNRRREDATTAASFTIEPFRNIVGDPNINQQPIPLFPVICVYGDSLQPATPMPSEGTCDFIYYDSFFKDGQNRIGPRATPTTSLSTFFKLSKSGNYTSTQMGIGFSQYGASEALNILNTDEGDDYMLNLWKDKGLRHYGILDVEPGISDIRDLYSLLGALRSQQKWNLQGSQTASKPTAYLFLGVTFRRPRDGPAYAALEMLFAKFPVDALIARTHLAERDDGREDCHITGPTVYKDPPVAYQLSLWHSSQPVRLQRLMHRLLSRGSATALLSLGTAIKVDVVQFLHEKRHSFGRPTVAVSFTMQARWYRPSDISSHYYFQWWPPGYMYPYPGYKPGQPCTSLGDKVPYTSPFYICSGDVFAHRLEHITDGQQVMFTFSERESLSLLFDSDATIRTKYCNLRTILNGLAYGIALFDGAYDAWATNPCGDVRNLKRVRLIRRLVDHVKKAEAEHYPNDCSKVT